MALLRRDGCASLAGLLPELKEMLEGAAGCYDRMLRRLKLTADGKQLLPRANQSRWAATFDSAIVFDTTAATCTPPHRRHLLARLLLHIFTPSLLSAIATYLGCTPELIFMDGVQAILYHGKAPDQQIHVDHDLGPNISLVIVLSLTGKPITTRFAIGTCWFDLLCIAFHIIFYLRSICSLLWRGWW